ncbi:MAG: NHL repeat-containing protein, partial [Planctomycetota bacterium]
MLRIRHSQIAAALVSRRTGTKVFRCGVALLVFGSLTRVAFAEVFLSVWSDTVSSSRLEMISTTDCVTEFFPPLNDVPIVGTAYDESTGTLFGTDALPPGLGLYTIDTETGATTLVGLTDDPPLRFYSLAIQPETFELFGLTLEGELWVLDKMNAAATYIGADLDAFNFAHGLAFSPSGTLYATDTVSITPSSSELFTIDPNTGEATIVATINLNFLVSLDFAEDGTLFGVDNGTDRLVTIDVASGDWEDVCLLTNPELNHSIVVRLCPSDVNGDGVVNVLDLIDLLLCFG